MSDAPYEKQCNFCKNKITMSKQSGSWLPYELNSDKKHDCRTQDKKQAVETLKEIVNVTNNQNNNNKKENFVEHDVRDLQHVLAELRLIGIEIDVDKLLGKKKESEYIK